MRRMQVDYYEVLQKEINFVKLPTIVCTPLSWVYFCITIGVFFDSLLFLTFQSLLRYSPIYMDTFNRN